MKTVTTYLLVLAVTGFFAASASAGLLLTGKSYNDGTKTWEGSKTFSKGVTGGTLAGKVDWAVFTDDNFSSLFTDYTPTSGELVYTYQVFNTGTVDISLTELPLLSSAPADNPGVFTGNGVSGQNPFSLTISGPDVIWDFEAPDSIVHPGNSTGLAVSSIRKPATDFYVVIDGGSGVNVSPVAGPGTVPIPEPCTLLLLALAAATVGLTSLRKRMN